MENGEVLINENGDDININDLNLNNLSENEDENINKNDNYLYFDTFFPKI